MKSTRFQQGPEAGPSRSKIDNVFPGSFELSQDRGAMTTSCNAPVRSGNGQPVQSVSGLSGPKPAQDLGIGLYTLKKSLGNLLTVLFSFEQAFVLRIADE